MVAGGDQNNDNPPGLHGMEALEGQEFHLDKTSMEV